MEWELSTLDDAVSVLLNSRSIEALSRRKNYMTTIQAAVLGVFSLAVPGLVGTSAQEARSIPNDYDRFTKPPVEHANRFGEYKSLLRFADGRSITTPAEWPNRREEIHRTWQKFMGSWPPLLAKPKFEILESTSRGNVIQSKVRVEIAPGQMAAGYLLVPSGTGSFPAVLVPYYEPETSIGISKQTLRDFGYQLAKLGCVTLSIGSPGGDARKPSLGEVECQPLSFLAYVAANCHTALAQRKEVDPARIGVVGHSYGGKWAMFAACLYEKFACGAWSDPGIVFDESRPNVNYWEPWYLGLDPQQQRSPGVPSAANPRTGAYRDLVNARHDLHELLGLMAPRPFMVSGGSEDPPERWLALNRVVEVYELLDARGRVLMTNRQGHTPTEESNEQIYAFFTRHFSRQKNGQ